MTFASQPWARPLPPSRLSRFSLLWLVPAVLFTALALPPAPPSTPPTPSLLPAPEAEQSPMPQAEGTETKPTPPSQTALPQPAQKLIRVGLTSRGGPVALWCKAPLVITDPAQPGRSLAVQAEEKVTFAFGAVAQVAVPGAVPGKANQFWSGPLQIRTASGTSGAWQSALVSRENATNEEFIRLTSDGANPRWGRPYRGALEVTPRRVVNVVEVEDYLKGVVPWEMGATAPLEALKAQAVCARSNLLAKMAVHRHAADGFDVCDFDHCQGYPGAANEKPATTLAVEQTKGLVLFYKGRVADAVYGTNSGGITASDDDVWRGKPTPYLRGVRDFSPKLHTTMAAVVKPQMTEDDWAAYCAQNLPAYAQPGAAQQTQLASRRATSRRVALLFQPSDLPEFYRWSRFVEPTTLAQALATQPALKVKMDSVTEIRIVERAPSGHIKKLAIFGVCFEKTPAPLPAIQTVAVRQETSTEPPATGNRQPATGKPVSVVLQGDSQIRAMLSGRLGSTTALPSSTFVALPQRDETGALQGWILKGAGWGHGVGMCQRGAQNHAREGWDARRILQHYFCGVEVQKMD